MPCRNMTEADRDYAVCCAVPIDAPGLTLVARPAGRPGDGGREVQRQLRPVHGGRDLRGRLRALGARLPRRRDGGYSAALTYAYATHHRHTCIAARAGFGDLLIGAGVLMTEANGIDLDRTGNLRESHGRSDQDRRGLLRLRRRRVGLRHARRRRRRRPRRGLRQRRQAPAGHADLRHAPARAPRVGRPHRDAARARRGSQSGDGRPALRAARGPPRRPVREAHRGGAADRRLDRLEPGRLVLR